MRKMNLMKRAKTGAAAIVAICSLLSGGIVNAAENDGETTETSIEVTNEAGEDQAAVDDESIWDDSSEIIYHENGYYSDNIMAPRKGNTGSVSVNNAAKAVFIAKVFVHYYTRNTERYTIHADQKNNGTGSGTGPV